MMTFSMLKKQFSLEGLYFFCRNVAEHYAATKKFEYGCVSDVEDTIEKFNITRSCFYRIIDLTITRWLITDATIYIIQNKKLDAQQTHGHNGFSTKVKFSNLLKERYHYSAFSKTEVRKILQFIFDHPELSVKDVATHYGFISFGVIVSLLNQYAIDGFISLTMLETIRINIVKTSRQQLINSDFLKRLEHEQNQLFCSIKETNLNEQLLLF